MIFNFPFNIDVHAIKSIPLLNFCIFVGMIALFSLYFFYQSYKNIIRSRIIQDTPRAKIRSAAQGYVELQGLQQQHQTELTAPLSKLPCTWFRYTLEYYNKKNEWQLLSHGESDAWFAINDGTGVCIIIPKNAQITTPIVERWQGFSQNPKGKPKNWLWRLIGLLGRFRYCEWRMDIGMPLYALGNFQTKKIADANTTVNILSSEGLTARYPFILSAFEQKKALLHHKRDAFIWFLAYLTIMVAISWLIVVRME